MKANFDRFKRHLVPKISTYLILPYLVRIFRVSVSSFGEVCSAVFPSISWARCLPVVTAESG